jgi:hypothetical protein
MNIMKIVTDLPTLSIKARYVPPRSLVVLFSFFLSSFIFFKAINNVAVKPIAAQIWALPYWIQESSMIIIINIVISTV